MEKNNETNLNNWVDGQVAKLNPTGDWQPNLTRALARFKDRRAAPRISTRKWTWAAACVLAAYVCVSAFPAPRVFAQRCADACAMLFLNQVSTVKEQKLDFNLKDVSGADIHLSAYKGKVVLLNFWATWCAPCKVEIPWFMEFNQRYKDSGLAVIGVSMDDSWNAVKPYLQAKNVNYTMVVGNDDVAKLFGVEAMPVTMLIGRDGKIAATHMGLVDKGALEGEIQRLLQ